jgi:hypothetical protein
MVFPLCSPCGYLLQDGEDPSLMTIKEHQDLHYEANGEPRLYRRLS